MKQEKLVSTIIPTYKRNVYLLRAIKSVLNQTYKNVEVIVVDDNGINSKHGEDTAKLMSEFRNNPKVIYIQHENNQNGANARNTGIRKAKGEFITFLDDDDEFSSQRFEKLVPILDQSTKEYGVISSAYSFYKGTTSYKSRKLNFSDDIVFDLLADKIKIGSGSNFILKREVIEKVKGFDPNFLRHQDFEFLVRVATKYKIMVSDEYLLKIYTDSSQDNSQSINNLIKTKKQYLEKYDYLVIEKGKKKILNSQLRSIVFLIFINKESKSHRQILEMYKKSASISQYYHLKMSALLYVLFRGIVRAVNRIFKVY